MQSRLAETEKTPSPTRTDLADRNATAASLGQQIASMSGASQPNCPRPWHREGSDRGLTREIQTQADLANLKITTLASMLKEHAARPSRSRCGIPRSRKAC